MKKLFVALLAMAMFTSSPSSADGMNLADYIQKLKQHPKVLEILANSEERKELSSAAMGLPDPVLIIGVDNLPVDDPSFDKYLPSSKIYGFKQQIPNYSLRKANSNKQKQLSFKERLVAEYTSERLKSLLISTIINLDKVDIQTTLAKKQLARYKELEAYFKGRLESGSGVYWRFSQVDVERSLVEQQLNNLNAEHEEIEAELIRLVGEVPSLKIYQIESEKWNSENDLYPVSIAKENVNVNKIGVDIADAAYGSNFGFQALYKERESGATFDGEDWFSVQATVSIPLWSAWNQAPKKRAAVARKHASEQRLENTKRLYLKKIKTLESKRDAALKNVHILTDKDKAFKEMVASANRTYESGETTLEALLESKISRLSIKSQLAEQRFRHMSLLAKINSYIRK